MIFSTLQLKAYRGRPPKEISIIQLMINGLRKILKSHSFHFFFQGFRFSSVGIAQCSEVLLKIWLFLPWFSRGNWQVIFEVFQSNFGFGRLNSTVRCLVWIYEQYKWKIFAGSLRSHISKSGQFTLKISHCELSNSKIWYAKKFAELYYV